MAESSTAAEVDCKEVKESPTKTAPEGTLSVDAFHNFLQGKRHILVQDFSHAVLSLGKACEMYAEHYGQTALECAEVYFYYGKALFRLFQQQAGIIEEVLPDDSNEDEDEDEENGSGGSEQDKEEEKEEKENTEEVSNEEVAPADDVEDIGEDSSKDESDSKEAAAVKAEENKASKEDGDAKVESSDSKVEYLAPEEKNDPEPMDLTDGVSSSKLDAEATPPESQKEEEANLTNEASAAVTENGDVKSTSETAETSEPVDPALAEAGPSTSKPKTEEEISDLQLAWETLETAKTIFQRNSDGRSESELRISEILLILAEISLELENYESALGDLKECLGIRHQHLSPDDRNIAETFYQMALVCNYGNQMESAIEYYERSIDVILLRIGNLKKQTVILQNEDGFDIDPAIEIADLEAILPDIRAKLEDAHDMRREEKRKITELALQKLEANQEVSADSSSSSSAKPVTNITHLLKRKKPEDVDSSSGTSTSAEVKRIKLTSVATNGENQVNDFEKEHSSPLDFTNPDSTSSPPKL